MEASPSTEAAVPVVSQTASSSLKNLLTQARGTRQMLLDFKAALDDCTVHGSHVYALALGVQFLNTLIGQAKGDIESIQNKLDAEAKKDSQPEASLA